MLYKTIVYENENIVFRDYHNGHVQDIVLSLSLNTYNIHNI